MEKNQPVTKRLDIKSLDEFMKIFNENLRCGVLTPERGSIS